MAVSTGVADERRSERFWKLYERLFDAKRPQGWEVHWRVEGLTDVRDRKVYLAAGAMRQRYDLETAIHEMLHVREPRREHGREFDREVRRLLSNAISKRKRGT